MGNNFAEDWKTRLNQCGTQKAAADSLGLTEGAVSLWGPKTGTIPGIEDHEKIATAYGVSPAWLAWGDGPSDRNAYERGLEVGVVLQSVPVEDRERFIEATMTLASLPYGALPPAEPQDGLPPELSALFLSTKERREVLDALKAFAVSPQSGLAAPDSVVRLTRLLMTFDEAQTKTGHVVGRGKKEGNQHKGQSGSEVEQSQPSRRTS